MRSRWIQHSALTITLLLVVGVARAQGGEERLLPRLAHSFAETRVAIAGGVIFGLPGLDAKLELGLVKAARGEPRGGVFVALGGHLGVKSYSLYLSPNPALRGVERAVCLGATMARHNPIYGDRFSLGAQVASVSASRKGGLGGELAAIPLPALYPWLRGCATLYVANPRLSRPSNAMLDRMERASAWAKDRVAAGRRWLGRQRQRLWRRARRARGRPCARRDR